MTAKLIAFLITALDDDKDRAIIEQTLRIGDPYWIIGGEASAYERRFSPERVITDSETKIAIAMMHVGHRTEYSPDSVKVCSGCGEHRDSRRPGCETVRLMASVYGERPDYLDEWRPR